MAASSTTNTNPARTQRDLSLQSSIAESFRCARELDNSVVHYRELLGKVAESGFVAHMRQLKASVMG